MSYCTTRFQDKPLFMFSVNQVSELLLNTAEFIENIVFSEESIPGFYKTFQDGSYFKQNFGEQELHIAISLYIDNFEFVTH